MVIQIKKSKKTIIIVAIIAAVFLVVAGAVVLLIKAADAPPKEPLTEERFAAILGEHGLETVDWTDSAGASDISRILIGRSETGSELHFQIELYLCASDECAKAIYEGNKAVLEDSSGAYSSLSFTHFQRYALSTDDSYIYLARREDTLLFVNADIEYKDEARQIIEKTGY